VGKDKRKRVYRVCEGSMDLINDWFTKRDFSLKAVS